MGEKNATRKMCGFLSEQERGVDVYKKYQIGFITDLSNIVFGAEVNNLCEIA